MDNNHPLLNPLIMGEVLKLLPRKDLLSARQVCSLWEEEASRIVRKEVTLNFQDLCQVNALMKLLEEWEEQGTLLRNGGEEEKGQVQIRKSSSSLPFGRINLRSSFRLGHPVAQNFFEKYGSLFYHVGVGKIGGDCGLNLLGRLLFLQAQEIQSLTVGILATPLRLYHPLRDNGRASVLPNLRVLVLRHQLFQERLPFVRDLLNGAVNLQEISTDPTSPSFVGNVLIPTLLETEGHSWKHLSKIKSPPLSFLGCKQLFRWMTAKNPPLKVLRLHFSNHSSASVCGNRNSLHNAIVPVSGRDLFIETSHINLLLEGLQGTLQSLELNNQSCSPESYFCLEEAIPSKAKGGLPFLRKLSVMNIFVRGRNVFPLLPDLREMSVLIEGEETFEFPGIDLEHCEPVPLMTRLDLRTSPGGVSSAIELWGREDRALGVLESAMAWWNLSASPYAFQLSSVFPCLRDLRVWGGNDIFLQEIYGASFAPFLESLEIHGYVTDAGITGLSPRTCERLHMTQDYLLKENESVTGGGFIGDLTRLKRLVVLPPSNGNTNCSQESAILLTEVSVFFGLTSCKDLVALDIRPEKLVSLWTEERSNILELQKTMRLESSSDLKCSSRILIENVPPIVTCWRVIVPLYGLIFGALLSVYLS